MIDDEFSPGKPPRALSDVIAQVLKRMKMTDQSRATGVFSDWPHIVGSAIAENVTPKKLEKRVLTVEVFDAAWATQLKFLESQLLSTLREHIGDEVDSLNITVRRSR